MLMPDSICNKCCKPATMMCQRCHETYCSTDCQILDWKEHKSKCHQMPNLVPIRKFISRAGSIANSTLNESFQSFSGGHAPMRQPHNRSHDQSRRNRGDSSSEVGSVRSLARNPLPSDKLDSENKPSPLLDDKDFILKPREPEVATAASLKGAIPKIACDAPWKTPFMPPEGKFFEVIVQWLNDEQDPSVTWVTEAKFDSSLNKLLMEINRNISKEPPCSVEDIKVGSLVAAPLENIYYRAEVLDVNNNSQLATVRLIDYGNQLQLNFAQLRASMPIMRNLNAYAIRVHLPKDRLPLGLELESVLSIRIIGANTTSSAGGFNVELKPATIPLQLPMELMSAKPAVLLKKVFLGGQHALLQFSSFKDFSLDMNEQLAKDAGKYDLDPNQIQSEVAFIAARTSQGWRRATFLGQWPEKASYLVYLIDEGRIGMCKEIKKIPDAFMAHYMRIIALIVTSTQTLLDESKLNSAGNLSLRLVNNGTPPSKNMQSLPCALFANEQKITDVMASTFVGKLEDLGVKCWMERIGDGGLVYITNVITQAEVFITSVTAKEYSKLFTSVAFKCEAYNATEEILQDDIVLVNLAGNGAFRGKILSQLPVSADSKSMSVFRVLDIDTGCCCDVSRNSLRKPNLLVRSCPVYVKKVKLIYVDKIPTPIADNKAIATLLQCKENCVEFIVKHDGSDPETVDLLCKTDEQQSLSKQLMPLLFEKTLSVGAASSTVTAPIGWATADETPLPPSPPDTPIIKVAPMDLPVPAPSSATAAQESPLIALPNLNIKQIEAEAAAKIFTLEDLEIIPIPEGDNIPLTVLDASTIGKGYITASDFGNKAFLQQMELELDKVKKHGKCPHLKRGEYIPKPNEICLTLFKEDNEWYRALCMNATKDGEFQIIFLDYGNMCVVTKDDILPITKDLMFPSNANLCIIEDMPPNLNKQQLLAFLNATLTNPIIKCKVKRQEDDTYNIKIHDMQKYFA